jgi:hypothetical protein
MRVINRKKITRNVSGNSEPEIVEGVVADLNKMNNERLVIVVKIGYISTVFYASDECWRKSG